MDIEEKNQRQLIVNIAKTWQRTPYHPMGRVKGAGTDCGMFILEVMEEAGIIPHVDIGYYANDHHFHSSKEDYLSWVEKFLVRVTRDPLPGDVVLYRIGKCISHGAIVIDYPIIIHACMGIGVVLGDASAEQWLSRQDSVYSYWGDK